MRTPKYNPAFLDPDERERRFGGRQQALEELLRVVRENSSRPRNQHVLVVGPRGLGKTTLLLRIADAVRQAPGLSTDWLPIVGPEETYRAGTIGEFWLEMVFNLFRSTEAPEHERAYERLREAHPSQSRAEDRRLAAGSLGYLLDFLDKQQRRALLIVENMQLLFGEQLSDADAWALRETLIGEPRIMLLGSALSSFREIENPKAALFEQFLVVPLPPLDTDACLDVWTRATGREVSRPRMRALEILTGGNPRLLLILADFAGHLSLRELTRDLASLLDEHTDYLKMTTEALPALERKVFVALAEMWEYASAAQVASQARVSPNVASAQLARLVSRGAVAWARRGRGKRYRIAERLYCIYHLMRRRGGVAARARAATEFMVAYYEEPALLEHVRSIANEVLQLTPSEQSEHLAVIGTLLELPSLERDRRDLTAQIPARLAGLEGTPEAIRRALSTAGREAALEQIPSLLRRRLEGALEAAVRAPEEMVGVLEEAIAHMERHRRSGAAARSANAWLLDTLSKAQSEAGQRGPALATITRAVDLYEQLARDNPAAFLPDLAMSLNNLATMQSAVGQREKALRSIGRAVEIYEQLARDNPGAFEPDLAVSRGLLGSVLGTLGRPAEAAVAFAEGLRAVAEHTRLFPDAHAPLAGRLMTDHIDAARNAGIGFQVELVRSLSAVLLAQDPEQVDALAALGQIETAEGHVEDGTQILRRLSAAEGSREARVRTVVALGVALGSKGAAHSALGAIRGSVLAPYLEPLIVALASLSGEPVDAPAEIEAVADDILEQIRTEEAADRPVSSGVSAAAPRPMRRGPAPRKRRPGISRR